MVTDFPSISPPAVITLGFVILLYGIHLVLFPFAITILLKKKLTRTINIMLVATVFMFGISTLLVVTLWTATIKEGTLLGIYFNQRHRAKILQWPKNMNAICADAMVVQRMFALYPSNQSGSKWIRWPMSFLMGAFTLLSIFNSIGEPRNAPFEIALLLGSTATFLSFGINLLATTAIVWKTWGYRRRNGPKQNDITKTLMLLIETGLVYLIWQFIGAVVSQVSKCDNRLSASCTEVQFVSNTLSSCTAIVAAILPTATLVIVALRKSVADNNASKLSINSQICSQCSSQMTGAFTPVKFVPTYDPEKGAPPLPPLPTSAFPATPHTVASMASPQTPRIPRRTTSRGQIIPPPGAF
ncbi:hypothetical protein DL96DRAFT_1035806 [Flagelloscypha sp. PMI_526]|nr:hypothetical protein DL96DRAFT_1035806 [Flagelloscypha sp. PMI_526]